jgi:predicted dehydrogenase
MKILCIGAGSMGRRRLRDLTHLAQGEVLLCEKSPERAKQVAAAFGVHAYTDPDEAFAQKPDVVSVSTPPAFHEEPVRRAMDAGTHVFSEVPFVLNLATMRDIVRRAPTYPKVLAASHSFRMYPPVRIIRDLICSGAIGKPLYLEHSLGQHVAGWHSYEHYKDFYAGDIRMGGAGTDMIAHEFLAIQWWMGKVESVQARLSKVSELEVVGPDLHDVLIKFASGARGFFHNDIIEHGTAGRHLRVAGDAGTVEWHENLPSVRVYRVEKRANEMAGFQQASDWQSAMDASREMTSILAKQRVASGQPPAPMTGDFTYESCYLREMRHFLDAVQGKAAYTAVTLKEELHDVEIYHAVLQSGETGQEVQMVG